MLQIIKSISLQILSFINRHCLIIFFAITTSLKLIYINTYILKVTWPEYQYMYGVFLSIAAVLIIFSSLLPVRKAKNKRAVIYAALISIILLVDVVYFSYFASLPSMGLIGSAGEAGGVIPAIVALLHPGLLLLFIDIFFVVIFRNYIKNFIKKNATKLPTNNKFADFGIIILSFVFLGFSIGWVGIPKINDMIEKSYDSKATAQYLGIIGAHIVDISRFIIQETTTLSSEEISKLQKWVNENKPTATTNSLTGTAKGKNIIMIQVESLGGFVIDQTINDKEITPNLNKLAKETQFFPNNRFIIGAGHTSDTDLVVNTSMFPLDDAATFVRYGQDNFTSLAKVMTQINYSANVYHGFNRNFWNRDVAMKSLGYQKFYAADNYSKGGEINMGLNDATFLAETADYLKQQAKPSFSYVITLTSHTPFLTNDNMKNLGIKLSDYPDQVGGYLENMSYVDQQLGKFFEKLKADELYEDSLILVFGDHTPVLGSFQAGSISYNPESVQGKEVPLFIKLPNKTNGQVYANKGTNLDVMPTVLDLIGVKTNFLMFGQSLFASSDSSLNVCSDQMVAFKTSGNCDDMLSVEKQKSAQIIRYNQFGNITK